MAVRTGGVLNFLLSDLLGSTSVALDGNGANVGELRYSAFGETRKSFGSTPTDYRYTGQRDDSYIKLLDYGSRYYDPELGRVISPDTILPLATQGTQAYDRYAYVSNKPVRYTDPTGHCSMCIRAAVGAGVGFLVSYGSQAIQNYKSGMDLSSAMNINNMDKGKILVATVGGAYAGIGAGINGPIGVYVNLTPFLPWHW